jgi:hypothetical protein
MKTLLKLVLRSLGAVAKAHPELIAEVAQHVLAAQAATATEKKAPR